MLQTVFPVNIFALTDLAAQIFMKNLPDTFKQVTVQA